MDFIRGDWRYFWPENISVFSAIPSSWDSSLNTGIGIQSINTLWITSYLNLSAFISNFLFGWDVISIFTWFLPVILLSFGSSFFLFKYLFFKSNLLSFISGLVYSTNTYFLLIFFGGQLGVAFAYSFCPLVLLAFAKLCETKSLRSTVIAGIVASLQLLFDPRLFIITFGISFMYLVLFGNFNLKQVVKLLGVIFAVILILHSYWLVPLILFPNLGGWNQTANSSVSFFSFAFIENTIGLLHPNWPENLFGKVHFMKFEYLIIPIIAFCPFLFIPKKLKKKSRTLAFFGIVTLVGVFLAKGVNEPFGFIYEYLFNYIPGFSAYRDSTKFYMLISLGYSVLVPIGLFSIFERVVKLKSLKLLKLMHLSLGFLLLWFILLRPWFIENSNLPSLKAIPDEYRKLKDLIVNENESFRTFWIPKWQRYGYFSTKNPAIGRGELVGDLENLKESLDFLSVKYVIVPYDPYGDIFVDDGKYSEELYKKTVKSVEKIPYLKKTKQFGKIVVFENKNFLNRFFITKPNNSDLKFKIISQTHYKVSLPKTKDVKKLIFSEGHSPYWQASFGKEIVNSQNYRGLNSFRIPGNVDSVDITFKPQKYVNSGLLVSLLSLSILVVFVLKNSKMKL